MQNSNSQTLNKNANTASISPASSTFRIPSAKGQGKRLSPGRVNKKGRHEWEMINQAKPKKTMEELTDEDVSSHDSEHSKHKKIEEPEKTETPEESAREQKQSNRNLASLTW